MKCVMVIDDNPADQYLAKHAIEGYKQRAALSELEILQAYDGEEALEVLQTLSQEVQPSIIFLDINMPRMDGFAFLDAYSKLDLPNSSVVVMVTSSDAQADINRTRKYGVVKKYLGKPLSPENIQEVVAEMTVPGTGA